MGMAEYLVAGVAVSEIPIAGSAKKVSKGWRVVKEVSVESEKGKVLNEGVAR